jgi:tripartite-type tricarboxylate transporter receptor subunit TctC
MNDIQGDRVDMLIDTVAAQKPFIASGATKPLAVFGPKRLPSLPDVPTLAELGLKGFDDQSYVGMLVPKGTPDGVVRKLNGALNTALADPDVKTRLEKLDFGVEGSTPEAFFKEMKSDSDRFAELADATHIEKQ